MGLVYPPPTVTAPPIDRLVAWPQSDSPVVIRLQIGVPSNAKMCVTCDAKTPSFAPPGSKTARWCKACSVNQPGALLTYRQRCEDCNKSTANWGLRDDPKVRT